MILQKEREQVVAYGIKLLETGLTSGTFGNLSVYNEEEKLMAISPSGVEYREIRPEDVAVLTLDGEQMDGDKRPSSEFDMHRVFYLHRPDVRGVVHTHSLWATTLSCLQWEIEPVHYLIAYAGDKVPCIPYVQFGTYKLAKAAYEAMGEQYNACLLGNHGLVAVGSDLDMAMKVAEQMEYLSQIYYYARMAGGGVNLSKEEIQVVERALKTYGKKNPEQN